MKLPRSRFTIRRLMVAVAIVAVILASTIQVIRLHRLSARYEVEADQAAFREMASRQRADMLEELEKNHLQKLRSAREELAKPMYKGPEWKEFLSSPDPFGIKFRESKSRDSANKVAAQNRLANYWSASKERYLRGVRHPWLPVEPDPPEP